MPTVDAFNETEALGRVGGDRDLLVELANLFLEQCPALVKEARLAVFQKDAPKVRVAAHTLKGSAATFAALPTVEAAQSLETIAGQGDLNGAARALTVLEESLRELKIALGRMLPEAVP